MTNNLKAERTLTAEERVSDEVLATMIEFEIDARDRYPAGTIGHEMHRDQVMALTELQRLRSQSLSTQQPMGEVRVKALEWVEVTCAQEEIERARWDAYTDAIEIALSFVNYQRSKARRDVRQHGWFCADRTTKQVAAFSFGYRCLSCPESRMGTGI